MTVLDHSAGEPCCAAGLPTNGSRDKGRVVVAPGRRSRLPNLTAGKIAHFRAHVEVLDLVGTRDATAILAATRAYAARDPSATPD